MNNNNFSCGSEWRKWDLHFHTPSSHDYQDKSITDKEIIDNLVKKEIAAVAITDHHTIDVNRIRNLQKLGRDKITIFPAVEFCSELGGSELMHYIGIFPETSDIDHIWKEIEVKCKLTEKDKKSKGGFEKLFCDFEFTSKLIHKLGGLVSIHAGEKSNSIESLKNKIKDHLESQKCIDILEVGKVIDQEDYVNIVFPNIKRKIPIVICSDNHNIKKYSVTEKLWIKADPTFEGLRQIIYEPEARIFIGVRPEILDRLENEPTKFIKKLRIEKLQTSSFSEKWFEGIEIDLNPELVAIIGNKGKGKSAILDTIGFLGNSLNYKDFSFLNDEKFNKLPQKRGDNFEATLEWGAGEPQKGTLTKKSQKSDLEYVKCIPQNYLEKLCTNISEEKDDEFQNELKEVIFSHVPDKDRSKKKNLNELEDYKADEIKKAILVQQNKLKRINERIVNIELKNTESYRKIINEKKDKKETELKTLKKPDEVVEPDKTKKAPEMIKLYDELIEHKKEKKEIVKTHDDYREKYTKLNSDITDLKNAKRAFEGLKKQYDEIRGAHNSRLKDFNINIDDVIKLQYNENIISEKLKNLKKDFDEFKRELDVQINDSCANKLEKITKKIAKISDKLDEPTKTYQVYLEKLKIWEDKKKEIEGNRSKEGTLEYFKNESKYLEIELKKDIMALRKERLEIVNEILLKKNDILNEYSVLYSPITEFINQFKKDDDEYQINFDVTLNFRNFDNKFFDYVLQNVSGSFFGYKTGAEKIKEIKSKVDIKDSVSIINFLKEIVHNLENDTRNSSTILPNEITKQIKPEELNNFYNFLFGLDYLEPDYKLMLGSKLLSELSPGEKGAVLLIFYLLIDKSDNPLLIDQPEENLDNESVYRILVEYIRIAKKRRQIIIVTHNPNLAVVCDAEQIISVNIDKKDGNKFSYISGGIENPIINSEIIRILEGTMPAFDLRDKKYSVSKRLQLQD